ncbi:DUF6776 family protein [Aerolutibacter ruishenii]|uniref:Uncharacterized protein n=1 Tax=Aerolutibacter ruishenii TaxID=686800 RepID=A0A562LRX5_9GAMM|nr:DUF6776 family protein [Lysobacter ruishenii]TWI10313.1 hypothetical protein IP93_01892 [Lysobacter ruishenii]
MEASPTPSSAAGSPIPPARGPRARYVLALLVAIALLFGLWGAWRVFAPSSSDTRGRLAATERQLAVAKAYIEEREQQIATLKRSDQISRDANRDLQGALAEREEEIAGLRADVAFYERLVGATGQRRGLSVHALRLQAQGPDAWHFATTLTQNLNRGAVSTGQMTLAVEGTQAGKLRKLAWSDLRRQPKAPGVAYSFKYFEQVEGDVFLPAGFTPVRVEVRLQPRSGGSVTESFTWADATRDSTAAAP